MILPFCPLKSVHLLLGARSSQEFGTLLKVSSDNRRLMIFLKELKGADCIEHASFTGPYKYSIVCFFTVVSLRDYRFTIRKLRTWNTQTLEANQIIDKERNNRNIQLTHL
jgi:hypothetical protein